MVHNTEKYTSINFYEYAKMNQDKQLKDQYRWEYERYTTALDQYKAKVAEYNDVIRHNETVDQWQQLENSTGNYYARYEAFPAGKAPAHKKVVPSIPCKPEWMDPPDEIDVYEYYNVEKFTKSWMLNISPNWKGVEISREMINFFVEVIELFYSNCNRFTKMKYVLENGHGRDHLHAHIVFTLNTKKPGYMTPIKKGNILNEFRNCWNRLIKDNSNMEHMKLNGKWFDPEGYYCNKKKKWIGLIDERCALNTCLLTSHEMLRDKLDYLYEELKPASHQNDQHPLCPVKGSKGYD